MHGLTRQSYLVLGTDTGVGKTYYSAQLIKHFTAQNVKAIGMKPIASGFDQLPNGEWQNEDVAQLSAASNVVAPMGFINPYAFRPAIAPHIAADESSVNIEITTIVEAFSQLSKLADVVVVEGAGGLMVPLNPDETLLDLAKVLQLPVIVVVGMRLGCINHALLTVNTLLQHQLNVAGWVANQIDPNMSRYTQNLETLKERLTVPMLTELAWQQQS